MKKIFFIIMTYSKGGGAEALLTTIVNHLDPFKYEVGIMEIVHNTIKQEPVNSRVKIYPYYIEADDLERKAKMYYVYHEWDKVIDEYIPKDYDLYVSFNYLRPSFLLPCGKKNIAWMHGDVYNLADESLTEERSLQNKALYKANRIIAVSDITEQSLYDVFPDHRDRVHVIYNGVDTEMIERKSKELCDVQLQHPALLSIGRLDDNKDPMRLLDIFEELLSKVPEAHLYYLGYGILEKDVKVAAKKKKIMDHVHLLGYYDNPYPIIAQCDVSCMFSKAEGFPMALLESVTLGKPYVSSVIGGARVLTKGYCFGRVVQTDEEAVEGITEYLYADKEIIRNECRKAIKSFNLETYIERVEELFDELLEEN